MALIKCEDCGHDVSDKAMACPNCGCPTEHGIETENAKKLKKEIEEMENELRRKPLYNSDWEEYPIRHW